MTTDLSEDIQIPRPEVRNTIFAILISIFAIVLLRTAWVDEDAYITFRTISNFFAHQGFVYNVGERVQAFTHPLWLFLMSAVYYFFYRDFFYASIILSIVLSLTTIIILATRVSLSTAGAALGISVLVLSKAFVDYSTSGLENPLSHFLVILFLVVYFRKTPTVHQLFLLAFVAALGTLNRPDSILLYLPALIHTFWKVRSKQAVVAVILGFLPMIIWEAFSIFYYGFPFPNTFYAKLNTGIPSSELAQQGFFYLFSCLNSDPLTIIAIICAIILSLVDRNLRHILIALGILFYLAYVVKIGGDFMAGRFLTIPLIASIGIVINRRLTAAPVYFISIAAVILLGMTSPYPTLTSNDKFGEGRQDFMDRWGITDERAARYQGAGLLKTTSHLVMPNNTLVQKGIEIKRSGQTVYETCAIGYAGFYAGRGVYIMDHYGLSDSLLARLKPRSKAYWFMAQFTRFVPDGYIDTITSGENKIANKDLATYYDKLSLVISGRLTDPRRLVEIWKLNFGYYNNLIAAYEDSLLLHVSLADINTPGTSTVPHNEYGHIIFPMYGIKIDLDQPSNSRHVKISLEDKTAYIIVFSRNGREIGRALMEGSYSNNFETMTIGVPSYAAQKGYDQITILPSHAIPTYLLGGFELLP